MCKTYYVGWDVGAWHCDKNTNSRDAIVIQDKESEDVFLFYGNATNFFGEENLDAFFRALFPDHITENEQNEYKIAVDAVLGWPKEFIALITGKDINTDILPKCKKENCFLLRECERELPFEDIQPLSAVQDMLGSQSTKVLFFLRKFGFNNEGSFWSKDGSMVYETYPAIIAKMLEDKDLPNVSKFYHAVSRQNGRKSIEYEPQKNHQDFKDALLALAALKTGFKEPEKQVNKIEGWIWLPEKTEK